MVGPAATESAPNVYDRVVVLDNSRATNSRWAQGYLSALADSEYVGDRLVTIETEPVSADTKDKLDATVKLGDVVVVKSGDKVVGDAADVLLDTQIPLLPIWAGNANDIARMLNGKPGRHGLLDIIRYGTAVELFPIRYQTTLPSGTRHTNTAANYVGFGLSGLISNGVNEPEHRQHPDYHKPGFRRRRENMIGVRAAMNQPSFGLTWEPGTSARLRTPQQRGAELLDMTVAAGDRMGKRGHVLPVNLADRQLFVGHIEPGAVRTAIGIGRLAFRHAQGQHLEPGEMLAFRLATDAWMHADGDARLLPADTVERIWLSNESYRALSMNIST